MGAVRRAKMSQKLKVPEGWGAQSISAHFSARCKSHPYSPECVGSMRSTKFANLGFFEDGMHNPASPRPRTYEGVSYGSCHRPQFNLTLYV
jgi:hypothetical protein